MHNQNTIMPLKIKKKLAEFHPSFVLLGWSLVTAPKLRTANLMTFVE